MAPKKRRKVEPLDSSKLDVPELDPRSPVSDAGSEKPEALAGGTEESSGAEIDLAPGDSETEQMLVRAGAFVVTPDLSGVDVPYPGGVFWRMPVLGGMFAPADDVALEEVAAAGGAAGAAGCSSGSGCSGSTEASSSASPSATSPAPSSSSVSVVASSPSLVPAAGASPAAVSPSAAQVGESTGGVAGADLVPGATSVSSEGITTIDMVTEAERLLVNVDAKTPSEACYASAAVANVPSATPAPDVSVPGSDLVGVDAQSRGLSPSAS